MKLFIILAMCAILYSLGSSVYFLLRDKGENTHMVKSLMWRAGLSVALFIALFIAFAKGYIQPHSMGKYIPKTQLTTQA